MKSLTYKNIITNKPTNTYQPMLLTLLSLTYSQECMNLLHGIDFMFKGWNTLDLDIWSWKTTRHEGSYLPVLRMICNGSKFEDHVTREIYELPTLIPYGAVTYQGSSVNKVDAKYLRFYNDYRDNIAINYASDDERFILGNSQTINLYIDQTLKITEEIPYPYGIGYANIYLTSYDIINPYIDQLSNYLDQLFLKIVASTMSEKINTKNADKYYNIYKNYGTHIPTQINL